MERLTKAKLKLFASLHQKKYRYQHGLFLAEGWKMLSEALESNYEVEAVVAREGVDQENVPENALWADAAAFDRLSTQVHSEGVLTVLRFPGSRFLLRTGFLDELPAGAGFLLDDLRDPGNLGTLIRSADWFGLPTLICSKGTVDPYNPKVVRAAMGSLFRVQLVLVEDFERTVAALAPQIWVADMAGEAVTDVNLPTRSLFLLGNEANGVRPALSTLEGLRTLTIPRTGTAESLNAGVAASVLAALWRFQS